MKRFMQMLGGVLLWACAVLLTGCGTDRSGHAGDGVFTEPKPIPPFQLVDQSGAAFNAQHLQGAWSLLFFGYTNCPEACPRTMMDLTAVLRKLAKTAPGMPVRAVLVTVDPERDTPQVLAHYLTLFNASFIGITGERAMLDGFLRHFGVMHLRSEPAHHDHYLVDHSGAVILVDPQGRWAGRFVEPIDPRSVADTLSDLWRQR